MQDSKIMKDFKESLYSRMIEGEEDEKLTNPYMFNPFELPADDVLTFSNKSTTGMLTDKDYIKAGIGAILFPWALSDETKQKFDDGKENEMLTIVIDENKAKYFKYLRDFASTEWGADGYWTDPETGNLVKDDNNVIKVQFKDTPDERYSEVLMALLEMYNREYVDEDLLYAYTQPIEQTTL